MLVLGFGSSWIGKAADKSRSHVLQFDLKGASCLPLQEGGKKWQSGTPLAKPHTMLRAAASGQLIPPRKAQGRAPDQVHQGQELLGANSGLGNRPSARPIAVP